jgi:hypothetical protein
MGLTKVHKSKLKPNPYRNIERYKIDENRVKILKASIEETGLWGVTFVARKSPEQNGHYEIAFGHHRLKAVMEIDEIQDVRLWAESMDDMTMLKRMANENSEVYGNRASIINETVFAAKDFLDAELAKYGSWDHADKNIRVVFSSNSQFQQCKQDGVGRETLLKFLGGAWNENHIQEALTVYYSIHPKKAPLKRKIYKHFERDAYEMFEKQSHARAFAKHADAYSIRPNVQKRLATELAGRNASEREIRDELWMNFEKKKVKKDLVQTLPTLDKFAEVSITMMRGMEVQLNKFHISVQKFRKEDATGKLFEDRMLAKSFVSNLTLLKKMIDKLLKEENL